MRKLKLVDDWRRAWRYYSVQAMAALAGLPIAYMALPAVGVVLVAGIVGRIVKQPEP